MTHRRIQEDDFRLHTLRQRQRLSQDLQATGLSINEMSRLSRLNWDTVYKALNRRPVSFDSAERLRFMCEWLKEHTGTRPPMMETKIATVIAPAPKQSPATPPRGKGGKFAKKETAK